MIIDKSGNIIDPRNRKERRMILHIHHNVYTKQYHSEKSRIRSVAWLNEFKKENK